MKALRSNRNRLALHVLVYVLAASLVSALLFSACVMPVTLHASSSGLLAASTGCPEATHPLHGQESQNSTPVSDCSFKPCVGSQPTHPVVFKFDKPELPVTLLCLIWVIRGLILAPRTPLIHRVASSPGGRRIPLIYRFCALLN